MTFLEFLESKFGGCQWPRNRYEGMGRCPHCGYDVEIREIRPGIHHVICRGVVYEECDYATEHFSTPEEAWEAHLKHFN